MTVLAWAFVLTRPLWLLVLLAAPVFVYFTWKASRGRPRAADWTALITRTLLLLVIAGALAAPRIELDAEFRSVAFVLDVSESIPPAERDRVAEYVQASASLRGDDDDVSLVVTADGAAVETPFSRISESERVDDIVLDAHNVTSLLPDGESDLQAGLRLARAGFPPGGARRVMLFTDGNQTRGDCLQAVKALLADDVDVMVAPIRYHREREVHVRKLVAPSRAPRNQRMPIRAVVHSTHEKVDARIRFLVDGKEVVSQEAELEAGDNFFEMGTSFVDDAMHRIEVRVEPAQDGNPQNNRGLAVTHVRGDPMVLVVTNQADSPLAQTLSDNLEGRVQVTGPEGMPADPGELVPYDGVVLENVPAYQLSEKQRKYLAYAVREMGMGVVCVGGMQAYGPGGYAGTELEEILPVSSEVKQKRVLPSGALVIILHTCEFPAGNSIARDVTKLAIKALSAQDEIGVIEWGFGDEWVVELQRVGNKTAHLNAVDRANPSDMPTFGPAMTMGYKALDESSASVKHMMIISDGDASPPGAKLIQRLVDANITVTTICVHPHSGAPPVMQQIANDTGGKYYFINQGAKSRLPQIFVKEAVTVRRSAWKEAEFAVTVRGVHDMLRQFSEQEFPSLFGYTVTSLKENSELLLSGPEEDPVLATWRHGLGEVTAWTSDAHSSWSRNWVAWGGYSRFWSQVVRSTLRALDRPGVQVATDVEGGSAHVVLDALTTDGSFQNGLSIEATALSPTGDAESFKMTQTGPGRYEGSFPATEVGTYVSTLNYRTAGAAPDSAPSQVIAGACVAYSAEHLAQGSNERFFAVLEQAGATLVELDELDAAAAADPDAPEAGLAPWMGEALSSAEPVQTWPWLAALAALILVTDVAVRRVRFTIPALVAKKTDAPARKRPPPKPAKDTRPAAVREGGFDASAAPTAGAEPGKSVRTRPSGPGAEAERGEGGLLDAKRRAKRKQEWEEN